MAQNKVKPPTENALAIPHSTPKHHFLLTHQRNDLKNRIAFSCVPFRCIWTSVLCWIWYNLLLMAAILGIVTIFACVGQLSPFSESTTRQWPHFTLLQDYQHNEMHCYGFQSTLRVLNELVIKPPAELHTACGFKPYTVVVYSVHSWVCWVMLLSHWVHCKHPFSQWDLCLEDEYFPNGRKGQIRKTNFFSSFFFSTNRSRFLLILPVSLHLGGGLNGSFQISCQRRAMFNERIHWK